MLLEAKDPPEPKRTQLLVGLIQHVKPSGGVWCEPGYMPRIRYDGWSTPVIITWRDAEDLITGKKPPKREDYVDTRTQEQTG